LALTAKDVLRLIELLRQNDWLRDELRRVLLPHNFEGWMKGVDERLMRIESTLGELRGLAKELDYWRKAGRFLSRLLRNVREVGQEILERLEKAEAEGSISPEESDELLQADLLLMGEVRKGKFAGQSLLLVCELSATVAREDVERAIKRAQIARRAGLWAVPLVSGSRWSSQALKRWAVSEAVLCGQNGVLQPSPTEDWDAIEELLARWRPEGKREKKAQRKPKT